MLRSIVNRAMSGGRGAGTGMSGMGRRRPMSGGTGAGGMGTGTGGRRTQDEAIGRGVRGVLKRFR